MSYVGITRSLAGLALLALAGALVLLGMLAIPAGRRWIREEMATELRTLLALALTAAAIATGGSLWFSESVGFTPCLLCWYQRIAMYPLVIILGVATLLADGRVWRYVLPLSGVGLAIAAYHTLIQLQPTLDAGTCSVEAPCTARYVAVLGFLSIPVMAGIGFLFIGAVMLALREAGKANEG